MRPERLELEGFTAFRDPTVVDFSDAELFAFTGPTGSGKSSLIDAMVFALYGAVPRHGKSQVAPIITQGKLEAKVRFDFVVGDVTYTAVRVVKRIKTGATTSEARLQKGTEVLASSAGEVDEAVKTLMGLDFDQFTTCVVLPQGKFERFLHAQPADRQALLVALLDMGIYKHLAVAAAGRQHRAEGRLTQIEAEIGGMEVADQAAIDRARARLDALTSLRKEVEGLEAELEGLRAESTLLASAAKAGEANREALEAVKAPEGFGELSGMLDEARSGREQAAAGVVAAEARLRDAEGALGGRTREGIEKLIERRHTQADAQVRLEATKGELVAAEATAEAKTEMRRQAEADLHEARNHDLAQTLREALEPGMPCLVCGQVVAEIPGLAEGQPPSDVEAAVRRAQTELKEAEAEVSGLRALVERIGAQLELADHELREVASVEVLEAEAKEVDSREQAVAAARKELDAARHARTAADEGWTQAQEAGRAVTAELVKARDAVTSLGPPELHLKDPAEDWGRFLVWTAKKLPEVESDAGRLSEQHRQALSQTEEKSGEIVKRCQEAGLEPTDRPRDTLVEVIAEEKRRVKDLEAGIKKAEDLVSERERQQEAKAVAGRLALELRASNFEAWLLDEALRVLAEGANRRLKELGSGQYSLSVSGRLFEVIDHQAADEHRSTRSLSGGETFLVSLALALSLADHITQMAATQAARLESIFLDEGFGSLDSETLDTVTSVIAEVAAGKTVGIVTHVKELAEQMPVRFEVAKGPGGATVTKVVT